MNITGDVQTQKNITTYTKTVTVAANLSALPTGLLLDADPRRRRAVLRNSSGSRIVYIGFDTSLTTTTGAYLGGTAGDTLTLYTKGPVYGICTSLTQNVSVLEEIEESS